MFRTSVFFLYLLMGVQPLSNDQLIDTVMLSCLPRLYFCPKQQYAFFDGFDWEWDKEAVLESPLIELFRGSRPLTDPMRQLLRSTFCCTEGPCLFRCGIFPRTEIDLIKEFPANAMDILKLNLPEMEVHRQFVMDWINKNRRFNVPKGKIPAELEEFFDAVYRHQDLIRQKLREQDFQQSNE